MTQCTKYLASRLLVYPWKSDGNVGNAKFGRLSAPMEQYSFTKASKIYYFFHILSVYLRVQCMFTGSWCICMVTVCFSIYLRVQQCLCVQRIHSCSAYFWLLRVYMGVECLNVECVFTYSAYDFVYSVHFLLVRMLRVQRIFAYWAYIFEFSACVFSVNLPVLRIFARSVGIGRSPLFFATVSINLLRKLQFGRCKQNYLCRYKLLGFQSFTLTHKGKIIKVLGVLLY